MEENFAKNSDSLCQDKLNLERVLTQLKELLKDTDDQASKERIDRAVQSVAAAYRVMVVGEAGAGRTSLLEHVFMQRDTAVDKVSGRRTRGIEEIRFGAAEVRLKVDDYLTRRFSTDPGLEGLVLTDIGEERLYKDSRVMDIAEDAQVVLAVFSAENIQNPEVWSFLENYCPDKRTVCVMNKSDLYPSEIIEKKRKRLEEYMKEADIDASLFVVSLKERGESSGVESLRQHIREAVLGKNPAVERYGANISMVSSLLTDLKVSFKQRQLQYIEDQQILLYVNEKMDAFYRQQQDKAEHLKSEVFSVIRQEIDSYRECIIKKLDPKKLQNDMDVSDKRAFKEWLQHELEKRERILKQKVQEQMQKVMRWYYDDLAAVYEEAAGKLDQRKQYIGLDDRFYGSMQAGKAEIVSKTVEVAQASREQFTSLSQETEKFYQKVKQETERYDRMKRVSAMMGSVVSGGAAALGLQAAGTAAVASAPGSAAFAVGLVSSMLPIMGALVVGTAGIYAGMQLFECIYNGHFEKNMEKHIADFSKNVEEIRENMISQVGERMEKVFEQMLGNVDKAFLPFRTTTNIDSRNVPLLEDKLQSVEQLFDHFVKSLEVG